MQMCLYPAPTPRANEPASGATALFHLLRRHLDVILILHEPWNVTYIYLLDFKGLHRCLDADELLYGFISYKVRRVRFSLLDEVFG